MIRSIPAWALAVLVALATGACGGQNLTAPTTPAPAPQTEVFTGSLNINGAITHPFTSQAGGTITATLTTVDPDGTIGMSLGTWNGVACQITIANDLAVVNTTVTGTASSVGNFCVRLYDVGKVTSTTSYQVSVVHP